MFDIDGEHEYAQWPCNSALLRSTSVQVNFTHLVPSKTILSLLKITSRLPWRMLLHMIIKLLARELALTDFVLVLMRRDAMFFDGIAMAVFNGLGHVRGVGGFVAVPRLGGIRRIW